MQCECCAERKLDCAERQQVEPTVARKVTHFDFQSARFIETSGPVPLRPAPVPLGDEDSDGRQEPSRRRFFLAERGSFLCKRIQRFWGPGCPDRDSRRRGSVHAGPGRIDQHRKDHLDAKMSGAAT